MKGSLYLRLAWQGIKKNGKIYFPYLAACMAMIAVFYVLGFLSHDQIVRDMKGGQQMQGVLSLGSSVMGVFAMIFLFYTDSFLMKQRKKELGLYHMLGMDKRNLIWVLVWENLMSAGISLVGGLCSGILFSKAAQLVMIRLLQEEAEFSFYADGYVVGMTLKIFAVIFAMIFLQEIWQILRSRPVDLFNSQRTGERPIKVNWLAALLGLLFLGAAYFMALVIKDPVEILFFFFVAVVLVIVGTYLLFCAVSVAMCRILKKNKKYYYKTPHFISVSTMTYRMKRNGAGLASICILSTMVLVMVSSTASLFIGTEDSLRNRYPRNLVVDTPTLDEDKVEQVHRIIRDVLDGYGVKGENELSYRILDFKGFFRGNEVILETEGSEKEASSPYSQVRQIMVVPLEDYNKIMGTKEGLEPGEVLICNTKSEFEEAYKELKFQDGPSWKIKKYVDFIDNGVDSMQIIPTTYIFVSWQDLLDIRDTYASGKADMTEHDQFGLDLDVEDQVQANIGQEILERLGALSDEDQVYARVSVECVGAERIDFYSLYAGMFFLGILLGLVFLLGTLLIMYYKQVTEGYEDRGRFQILQKVGMTEKEIKKSIRSQVLTIFFLPLVLGGIHTAFAFPMIYQLLQLFGISDLQLFVQVTLLCFLAFGLIYGIMYTATAKVYYKIISQADRG